MTIFLQGADDELPTPKPQACLIVDGSNLFQVSLTADFNRTDAKRLKLALEVKTGCDITQAVYVGTAQFNGDEDALPSFASYYQQAGYEVILHPIPQPEAITQEKGRVHLPSTHHQQTDDSIKQALEKATQNPNIQAIILVSGDMDFLQPTLDAVNRGKQVFVCASQGTISQEMREAGTYIDLIELNQNPEAGPSFFYASRPAPLPETEPEPKTAETLPSRVWSVETAAPAGIGQNAKTIIVNIFVTNPSIISEIISQIMLSQKGGSSNEPANQS